ncbi:hypothetical protein C8Q76DRAFT_726897 [Earliella scabrosa]|nr:hypothetical protein C8Q76DRAFT_726897 [Earliella scabrosa]
MMQGWVGRETNEVEGSGIRTSSRLWPWIDGRNEGRKRGQCEVREAESGQMNKRAGSDGDARSV